VSIGVYGTGLESGNKLHEVPMFLQGRAFPITFLSTNKVTGTKASFPYRIMACTACKITAVHLHNNKTGGMRLQRKRLQMPLPNCPLQMFQEGVWAPRVHKKRHALRANNDEEGGRAEDYRVYSNRESTRTEKEMLQDESFFPKR
jgi:hypothetical protein